MDFVNLYQIKPEIEKFKFADINKAIERLRSGEARYRVVLCR
jgi:alcohol/geraniol dehydrogenase (NADP+)